MIQSAKAEEHAQARRALAALAGDTWSVPSTHVSIKSAITPVPGDPMPFLVSLGSCTWCTNTHLDTHAYT